MEKFIVYTKAYRDHYQGFTRHMRTVGYRLSSCKTFEPPVREFLYWLEREKITLIEEAKEIDIENFYAYLQERPNTLTGGTLSEDRVTLHMQAIKLFFRYLQDTEQTEESPMSNLNYARASKRTRENLLSHEDVQKLYDQCEQIKQRAILALIYGCGLRRQEAVMLNASDIHFRTAQLIVREGKGGRKRTVPLGGTVLTDLKEYYYRQRPEEISYNKPTEAFMINKRKRRMQGGTYSSEIARLIGKAKLDKRITLHHFRHAIATHLLESGMKTEHVKDFLGHRSIETTQTYTHVTTAQMKKTTRYGTQTIPC